MDQRLYIAEHPLGYLKVGRSKNPPNRLLSLRYYYPGLSLRWHGEAVPMVLSTGEPRRFLFDAGTAELTAHNLLNDYRLIGEWFSASLEVAVFACEQAVRMVSTGDKSLARYDYYPRGGEVEDRLIELGVAREDRVRQMLAKRAEWARQDRQQWAERHALQPPRKSVRNGTTSATVARQKREGRNHAGSARTKLPVD